LAEPAQLKLVGDFDVEVAYNGKKGIVRIEQPSPFVVANERHAALADYRPNAGGWMRGTKPVGITAQECTTRNALKVETLKVKSSDQADAVIYENGKDYQLTPDWGTVGRLPNGRIQPNQPVYFDYTYVKLRIDAIVQTKDGAFAVRTGVPHQANPSQAELLDGDTRLANIWINGCIPKLTDENLLPILETEFPKELRPAPHAAEKLIPKTYAKLKNGEKVKILAWVDSVTVGTFVPDWQHNRWQNQFVERLQKLFPQAEIELVTEAWGGYNTASYLAQPADQIHNYNETVLAVKPDLVISEFVNDAGLNEQTVYERYGKFLNDFTAIGAEWIILTPHYVRTDWMGLTRQNGIGIESDPRPYVAFIRKFASDRNVALADAAKRYGRLWRQGIPFNTLMTDTINHPDEYGMTIFADALMSIFEG
jgi:hypothetical protein